MKKSRLAIVTATLLLAAAITAGAASQASAAGTWNGRLTGQGKNVKNVILMISDGWGYNQILATNYYLNGKSGIQTYEKFPVKLAMSTYSFGQITKDDDHLSFYDPSKMWESFDLLKLYPTDSASAGTAMSTGFKTYDAAIGVDQDLQSLRHISEDFESKGRSTGVVSSVQISHATPASFVAHNTSRNNYSDIAKEMIMNSAADVIIGAGNPMYDDNGQMRSTVSPNHYNYIGGKTLWESLLAGTAGNDADGDGITDNWTLVQTKQGFEDLASGETPKRLIGIAQVYTTLQQSRSGNGQADAFSVPMNSNVPDLASMTNAALNVLDNNENGFFLMIEGGAVDWAGHANQSGRLIEEQADFNKAVAAVCEWVEKNSNWAETLLIVTGDHETGYLTGTKGIYDSVRNNGTGSMPDMAWNSANHTNQLIPFFAKGTGSEIFRKLADCFDPMRGLYLDNTEIVTAIRELIN